MNLRKRSDDNQFPSGNVGNIGLALFKGFAIYWILCAVAGLAMLAVIIYVVAHFLVKFW